MELQKFKTCCLRTIREKFSLREIHTLGPGNQSDHFRITYFYEKDMLGVIQERETFMGIMHVTYLKKIEEKLYPIYISLVIISQHFKISHKQQQKKKHIIRCLSEMPFISFQTHFTI